MADDGYVLSHTADAFERGYAVRKLAIALSLIVGYVLVSSLFAYVLFPEAGPYPSDLPRRGTVVLNPPIKSRFVFRRTAIETEGKIVEWDNFVEPGGGPINIPHIHPWMRETFEVIDGEITFIVDGKEQVVKAGSRIVIAPGSTHAFQNVTNRPAYMITRLEAATEGPWKELALRQERASAWRRQPAADWRKGGKPSQRPPFYHIAMLGN